MQQLCRDAVPTLPKQRQLGQHAVLTLPGEAEAMSSHPYPDTARGQTTLGGFDLGAGLGRLSLTHAFTEPCPWPPAPDGLQEGEADARQ